MRNFRNKYYPINIQFLLLFFIPFSAFLYPFHEDPNKLYLATSEFDVKRYKNLSIFIADLVITTYNLSRIQQQYLYWSNSFKELNFYSQLKVIHNNASGVPGIKDYLYCETPKIPQYKALLFSFYCGLETFIKSPLRWFFRTTEDVWVNYPYLLDFQNLLEKHYNPYKDLVILGQVCQSSILYEGYDFIHGGSGWIISRYAAEQLLKKKKYFLHLILEKGYGDDYATVELRKLFNLSYRNIHISQFLGSPLDDFATNALLNNNYTGVPYCPSSPHQYFPLTRKPIPFKKILVWHSGRKDAIVIKSGFKIWAQVPENLYIYFKEESTSICFPGSKSFIPPEQDF